MLYVVILSVLPWLAPLVAGHSCLWHESMWGFNVTAKTFPYDNRPVVPLMRQSFEQWWWHNHLDYPPPPNTFLELPAGGTLHSEISCDKGATTHYASSPGGDVQNGNNPCPGSPTEAFHASRIEDVRGCALGITYKSDEKSVKPEDFTIFTTNHTCVWYRFTDFQIPADLPACPDEGCICSFNWIHAPDSGSEQIFFNAYRCKVTNAKSNRQLATPRLARRCGPSLDTGSIIPAPWNCSYGAKQAIYWMQNEGNTFFEGDHDPPYYNDLYGFTDGAQTDIFKDSQIPVFNDKGEHTGYTILGDATETVAKIIFPTVDTWPKDRPDIPTEPSSSYAESNSGSDPGPQAQASPDPSPSSSGAQSGSQAANFAAEGPAQAAPPSPSPSPSPSNQDNQDTSQAPPSKCRKRANRTKKAKRDGKKMKKMHQAHQKMGKRHDVLF